MLCLECLTASASAAAADVAAAAAAAVGFRDVIILRPLSSACSHQSDIAAGRPVCMPPNNDRYRRPPCRLVGTKCYRSLVKIRSLKYSQSPMPWACLGRSCYVHTGFCQQLFHRYITFLALEAYGLPMLRTTTFYAARWTHSRPEIEAVLCGILSKISNSNFDRK